MRIGFLLGAGVSLPAGLPSTGDLTTRVLRVPKYVLHTDGSFVRTRPNLLGDDSWVTKAPLLSTVLTTLRDLCQQYFDAEEKERTVNYEDLFFAASQLQEHLSQEYENPVVEPFARNILNRLRGCKGRDQLREITELACSYITDVVALELSANSMARAPLACLVEAVRDTAFEGCDVFTLNHDVLIERSLAEASVTFVDGFGAADGDVSWWNPELLNRTSRTYVLKLHGSISWARYDGRLAKVLGPDRDHARTHDGELLGIPDRAGLLIGTFNKIRDYFRQPYFELFATLRRQMAKITSLLISGYSFGDKGINAVLTEWMYTGDQRRLIVLHADGSRCIARARGAIRNLRQRFDGSRMLVHPSHLCDCSWQTLRRQLCIR